MKIKTKHFLQNDDGEFEIGPGALEETLIKKKHQNGNYIIGYLVRDPFCENPCESQDGFGMIRSTMRGHINSIEDDEAIEILKGDPDSVALSYSEHGECMWGVKSNYDGEHLDGIWIPDDSVRESYTGRDGLSRRDWMVKQAANACEEYTEWANGRCYGWVVRTYDSTGRFADEDSCFGYVGEKWAMDELENTIRIQMEQP